MTLEIFCAIQSTLTHNILTPIATDTHKNYTLICTYICNG